MNAESDTQQRLRHCQCGIIRVGGGRGFVIEAPDGRDKLVITAAHCLPSLPPCHSMSYIEEVTFGKLLGPLGKEPTIAAECLFADPVADIAVLRPPDGQELYNEWQSYVRLTEEHSPLKMAHAREEATAWVMALHGLWFQCKARHIGGMCGLVLADAELKVVSGMSGSPIVDPDGRAIGVVSLEGGMNPRLSAHLPAWLAPPN